MNNIIDGKKISETIKSELKAKIEAFDKEKGAPGLAVVLVGERKDSQTYVRMKQKSAEEIGIRFTLITYPESVTQQELLDKVQSLNEDSSIHGIIVQLPLPNHIDQEVVLTKVSLEKDVDGFHAENMGSLAMKGRTPLFVPCTAEGSIELLDRSGVSLKGKKVVVLGRSNIVGIPAALLLLKKNATVTICHSMTQNLQEEVKQADVLIAAVGRPEMVRGDWVKEGVVVIDVGINPINDSTKKSGYRLVGDVNYSEVQSKASLITPVPGGVGPMTVAILLKHTYEAFERKNISSSSKLRQLSRLNSFL